MLKAERKRWADPGDAKRCIALCWLVSSSVVESYGQSRGHCPWTQGLCALCPGGLFGVVVAPLSERMT